MKSILTIAGLDPCGGAGIHADILTISSLGFHPCSVVTVITFQNTCTISGIFEIESDAIREQILAVIKDVNLAGIKVGLVCSKDVAKTVAEIISRIDVPKVVDPVIKATVGFKFTDGNVYKILAKACDVITPNTYELSVLSQCNVRSIEDVKKAARLIAEKFNCSVVVTGGSLGGKDVVFDKNNFYIIEEELVEKEVHGTGCVYSSALTCYLAKGFDLLEACEKARKFIYNAVKNSKNIGKCLPIVNPQPL